MSLTPSPSTDELIRCALDLARTCLGMEVGFVTEFRSGALAAALRKAPLGRLMLEVTEQERIDD